MLFHLFRRYSASILNSVHSSFSYRSTLNVSPSPSLSHFLSSSHPPSHSRAILYFPTLLPHACSRPIHLLTLVFTLLLLSIEFCSSSFMHPIRLIARTSMASPLLSDFLFSSLPIHPPINFFQTLHALSMSNTRTYSDVFAFVNHHALTRRTLTHCEVCPPLVDDSSLSTTETIARSVATCRRYAGTLFQQF